MSDSAANRLCAPVRVSVLGSPAAGKTCFLAGLGVLREADRDTPVQVIAAGATVDRLNELAADLRGRRWPPATTITELHELTVVVGGQALRCLIVDYPGED